MPYSSPALCHPDRLRKTADGLCDTCYVRRRYQTDPEYRDRCRSRAKAALRRKRPPPEPRECATCSKEFTPQRRGDQPKYCSRRCRDRSDDAKQRERVKARSRRGKRERQAAQTVRDIDIFERDAWRCGICRKRVGRSYSWPHPRSASIDHIVPASMGGGDSPENLQTAHLECNVRKGNRALGDQLRLVGL